MRKLAQKGLHNKKHLNQEAPPCGARTPRPKVAHAWAGEKMKNGTPHTHRDTLPQGLGGNQCHRNCMKEWGPSVGIKTLGHYLRAVMKWS